MILTDPLKLNVFYTFSVNNYKIPGIPISGNNMVFKWSIEYRTQASQFIKIDSSFYTIKEIDKNEESIFMPKLSKINVKFLNIPENCFQVRVLCEMKINSVYTQFYIPSYPFFPSSNNELEYCEGSKTIEIIFNLENENNPTVVTPIFETDCFDIIENNNIVKIKIPSSTNSDSLPDSLHLEIDGGLFKDDDGTFTKNIKDLSFKSFDIQGYYYVYELNYKLLKSFIDFKTVDITITASKKNAISSTVVYTPHNIVLFSYKNNNLNLTTEPSFIKYTSDNNNDTNIKIKIYWNNLEQISNLNSVNYSDISYEIYRCITTDTQINCENCSFILIKSGNDLNNIILNGNLIYQDIIKNSDIFPFLEDNTNGITFYYKIKIKNKNDVDCLIIDCNKILVPFGCKNIKVNNSLPDIKVGFDCPQTQIQTNLPDVDVINDDCSETLIQTNLPDIKTTEDSECDSKNIRTNLPDINIVNHNCSETLIQTNLPDVDTSNIDICDTKQIETNLPDTEIFNEK